MENYRIDTHPVLEIPERSYVDFSFNGRPCRGVAGEVISSALFANGIKIFGSHPKDRSAQGIFCANGQCAQCLVLADGVPVKACMTPVGPSMDIRSCEGLIALPETRGTPEVSAPESWFCQVLIVGAGPSGLAAAIELGKQGIDTILVDDKAQAGGKLVLQTHKFFGSVQDCYAGTRGIAIAALLEAELKAQASVRLMLNTAACGLYHDRVMGVLSGGRYALIHFDKLLIASGAREKTLPFPGCTLPGIYGAGAFQTLVNRDLVRAARRLFVIGGGNVGLIAAYHALQAGIAVVGLAEACPACGGYKVHEDKIRRLGVPVYLSHTVVAAHGRDKLESVTLARLDEGFKAQEGSCISFEVDTLLLAVGLNPVNEFYRRALEFGFEVWAAGDAEEIAEASSAMFSGKIAARKILATLSREPVSVPAAWQAQAEILKARPGKTRVAYVPRPPSGVFPVMHCFQEIPCNPCVTVCPKGSLTIPDHSLTGVPRFSGACTGCSQCVAVCPGLAISLVDYRTSAEFPAVTLAFEGSRDLLREGALYTVTNLEGRELGRGKLLKVRLLPKFKGTQLASFAVAAAIAQQVAGFKPGIPESREIQAPASGPCSGDCIICRCERVSRQELESAIADGVRDVNQLKAVTRATMGACGGKTCIPLIEKLYAQAGIPPETVVANTIRPLFLEVPFAELAGHKPEDRA